ncbi:MAG: pantetheine-phosphate adenylyltransferase [Deltaproteobacteria bacterium]|jgi:pantetheine-phosphate adenylyltransferase|nr:MAG: pantetheine-phosphate adenylyltransferase [Deltaproteobacteria bacterium]
MTPDHVAIYPGSFDPITNGHVDLVKRTLRVFGKVIVAIATNPDKDHSLFTVEERLQMINEVFADVKDRVQADSFQGLLVDYAERKHSTVVIRGLRAISDFEYEFQMAMMNHRLKPQLETLFMMTGESEFYTSSRLVKEVVSLGGNVAGLVPDNVLKKLKQKFKR